MTETGTVRAFDDGKGHGYIRRDGGGADAYVHHASIVAEGFRTLSPGDRVRFELVEAPKGPMARNVVKIGEEDDGQAAGGSSREPRRPRPPEP